MSGRAAPAGGHRVEHLPVWQAMLDAVRGRKLRGDAAASPFVGAVVFVRELYTRISDDRLLAISAGVTFYLLLAIFPAVGAGVSLYGLCGDIHRLSSDLSSLKGFLPGGAIAILGETIKRTIAKSDGTLGAAALFGLAFSIWSANAGMKAIFDALNIVLKEHEKRSFFRLNAVSLGFTFGTVAVVVLVARVVIGLSDVPLLHNPALFWPGLALGVVAIWAGLTLAIALVFRYGPSKNRIPWHWLTWGSGLSAFLLLFASCAFSFYAANYGSFDKTYGSLGAAIGFMTWIWLSIIVVLIGEEINEIFNDRKDPDRKRGRSHPLGVAKRASERGEMQR